MKKMTKKLVLAKETLRSLDAKELQDVEGAMPPVPVTRPSCTDC
jgi:hypothetical protein